MYTSLIFIETNENYEFSNDFTSYYYQQNNKIRKIKDKTIKIMFYS